jgi:ligand-binding sensor domain-containing protein
VHTSPVRALVVALGVAVAVAPRAPAWALAPDRPLPRCSVDLWRSRDGLPGDAIQALAQGADGALWIATLGGVARYDGRRLTTLEARPPLRAALGETVTLLATRDGDVYLASLHRDPLRVHQGVVTAIDATAGRERPARARAWTEDVRGQVWVADATTLFQGSGGGFVAQHLAGLEGRQPAAIRVDGRGTPWIGTDRGLF